jgi:hypothetical protein
MTLKLPALNGIVECHDVPEMRIDYEKFLVEYRQSGCLAKSARAVGISRRVVYWRAKHDPAFKAQLERIKGELKLGSAPIEITLEPVKEDGADWREKFEDNVRVHGLIHIASLKAGVEVERVEEILEKDPDYAKRIGRLVEEANSRMLYYARERAMSGRSDNLLLAWLKAHNEAFRERANLQVNATTKNAHVHLILNKETLEKLGRGWAEMSGGVACNDNEARRTEKACRT